MEYTDAFLDGMRLKADPVADTVIGRIVAEHGPEEAKAIFNLLIRNIDLPVTGIPDYVRTYMTENGVLPPWADHQQIARAQALYIDLGVPMMMLLYFKSLPTCYVAWRGANVLTLTGRLGGREWPETYARRIAETMQFVLDVLGPGGFRPRGRGIETLLKVRLIHASIRHFIGNHPDWKHAEWQVPINQEDLAYTLMTFSVTILDGLKLTGRKLSLEDEAAYYHLWMVAGHVLGVDDEIVPKDLSMARAFMERELQRQAGESEAGKQLTAALVAFSNDFLRGKVLDGMSPEMVRICMGEDYAKMLGIDQRSGCVGKVLPKVMLKALGWAERLEDRFPSVAVAVDHIGMSLLKGLRKSYRTYKGRGLEIPEGLAQAWRVE